MRLFYFNCDGLPDRLIMNALSAGKFRDEVGKKKYSITELESAGGTIQFTVVPPGQATRLAFDRDGDLLRDSVEVIDYIPGVPGVNTPFDPLDPDTSGNLYAIGPDGIPDWKNDFDGDGETNLAEIDRGTNPTDGWVLVDEFTVTATLSPDGTGIIFEWPGQRGRAYQVQGSGDLTNWTDIPGLSSPSNSGQMLKMTAPREGTYCYYRIRTD